MGCLLPAKFWRITGCTDIGQKLLIWRPTCQRFRICITCIGRKWTVWPEKIIFYWKRPKNPLFRGDTIQVMSLWRELEAKPVTSGQLLGHPWNVWDITLQMSYVEAWWHQNWVHSRPILCRGGGDAEISENLCFFIKRSVGPNLQIETFLGPAPTDSPRTQLSEYLYERYVKKILVRVIPVRSRERAAKRDLPAKIGTVTKKRHGHNFWTRAPKTNSVLKKWVSKDAIRFGTSPSKIVAVSFFRYGVLLVKKKMKRGSTSEGRNSAWNHHKLYVPYIFWKPRPCSFTWCYPIYVIHIQKN